jgi:hypothetical protein
LQNRLIGRTKCKPPRRAMRARAGAQPGPGQPSRARPALSRAWSTCPCRRERRRDNSRVECPSPTPEEGFELARSPPRSATGLRGGSRGLSHAFSPASRSASMVSALVEDFRAIRRKDRARVVLLSIAGAVRDRRRSRPASLVVSAKRRATMNSRAVWATSGQPCSR